MLVLNPDLSLHYSANVDHYKIQASHIINSVSRFPLFRAMLDEEHFHKSYISRESLLHFFKLNFLLYELPFISYLPGNPTNNNADVCISEGSISLLSIYKSYNYLIIKSQPLSPVFALLRSQYQFKQRNGCQRNGAYKYIISSL